MIDDKPDELLTVEAYLRSPEGRRHYEALLKKWEKRLRPLKESIRRSQRVMGDDLNIRVGPCRD